MPLGRCRSKFYRSERRKVSSFILPNLSLVVGIVLGLYVFYYGGVVSISKDVEHMTSELTTVTEPATYQGIFHQRSLLNASESSGSQGQYPKDLFTVAQKRQGAILLHIAGLCYMFLAVALACDEFFVPALVVIIDRLQISEDVAGATFMAAGGSAPELFISFFGTLADPESNVGIGTIVGSAVFNVLFVIGMCALFSRTVLELTWWPLFRDCTFYSLDLLLLIVFFLGEKILWWESLILFCSYLSYVIFMKYNHVIERVVKNFLRSNRVRKVDVKELETSNPGVNKTESYLEKAMEYLSSNSKQNSELPCFHYGAFQLVVNTMDPLWDASLAVRVKHLKQMSISNDKIRHEEEINLSTTDLQQESSSKDMAIKGIDIHHSLNGTAQSESKFVNLPSNQDSNGNVHDRDLGAGSSVLDQVSVKRSSHGTATTEINIPEHCISAESPVPGLCVQDIDNVRKSSNASEVSQTVSRRSLPELVNEEAEDIDDLDDNKPIDLGWPKGWRNRLVFIIKAPLMFPMYYTMCDMRKPEKAKYFPLTFIMSILWIGVFSYLMVWWATEVGDTFIIPTSVMGLTFLAAGTSIPDLITSVLVARRGFGDMAVSSSIGSNIFDITVGLPIPWLTYSAYNMGEAVSVSSSGLFCMVLMLFLMLVTVVITIALSKWRMSKLLGASMFGLYLIFIIMSLLLQYKIIKCVDFG